MAIAPCGVTRSRGHDRVDPVGPYAYDHHGHQMALDPRRQDAETVTEDQDQEQDDRAPSGDDDGPSKPTHGEASQQEHVVVGIGSSAGGFEAIKEMLNSIPENPGVAFVVLTHLDPSHTSHLAELLQRETAMPVAEATEGVKVETDRVYVLPPNAAMTIRDGTLRLHERDPEAARLVHVVDRFFRSLAEDRGHRAIGIVLSGTLTDGTQGMREIKAAGGFTLVQDPATAHFRGMPRSAIEAGSVDFVGSPTEIGKETSRLRERLQVFATGASPHVTSTGTLEEGINEVAAVLHKRMGVDFSQYKQSTLARRIQRRMVATGQETLHEYAAFLEESNEETRRLQEELLIHVTRFFRDPKTDVAILEHVLPETSKQRSAGEPLRIWVPGCATGEEVYTLAILVTEFLEGIKDHIPVHIFATDLSESAIRRAREGVYPETIEDDVSPERLSRFFERVGSGYQIRKHIRGLCIFSTHNLIADPSFSSMDLVSCRNVLVYMESTLQRRVLTTLHYALKSDGFLVLGPSESVGASKDLFESNPDIRNIYRRRDVTPSPVYDPTKQDRAQMRQTDIRTRRGPWGEPELQKEADRVLLDRYAPPGVVVNTDLQAIYFRGRTTRYLMHPSGSASLDLMRMAPEPLAIEIRNLVKEVQKKSTVAKSDDIRFEVEGSTVTVALEVNPVQGPTPKDDYFLITFLERDRPGGAARGQRPDPKRAPRRALFKSKAGGASEERARKLEQELTAAREHLQFVIEDYEATMEELRSANEEAISTNEELQSTNEELETTKEELQSTNEELSALNDELNRHNLEAQRINDDLVNLLDSVGNPIVMLGADLTIRRFTPQAREFLNLTPTDVGRPFTDIEPPFEIPDVKSVILDVFNTCKIREMTIHAQDGKEWAIKFHPYRTADHKVDGVVLSALQK